MTEQKTQEHTLELSKQLARLLADKKAEDITLLEVYELLPVCDYFLIATGRNPQHLEALSKHIEEQLSSTDLERIGKEGIDEGLWVLLDYGTIIVHLFQDHVREYYRVEGLWADAPEIDFNADE